MCLPWFCQEISLYMGQQGWLNLARQLDFSQMRIHLPGVQVIGLRPKHSSSDQSTYLPIAASSSSLIILSLRTVRCQYSLTRSLWVLLLKHQSYQSWWVFLHWKKNTDQHWKLFWYKRCILPFFWLGRTTAMVHPITYQSIFGSTWPFAVSNKPFSRWFYIWNHLACQVTDGRQSHNILTMYWKK